MAVESPCFSIGFCQAAADLSTKQFYCVKVTAAEKVNIATAAGEQVLGVLQNKPSFDGDVADVMVLGVTKAVIGAGGITAGVQWETAADGTIIPATTGKVGMGTVLTGGAAGILATVTVGIATGGSIV
jgi:hypothetical protein